MKDSLCGFDPPGATGNRRDGSRAGLFHLQSPDQLQQGLGPNLKFEVSNQFPYGLRPPNEKTVGSP